MATSLREGSKDVAVPGVGQIRETRIGCSRIMETKPGTVVWQCPFFNEAGPAVVSARPERALARRPSA